MRKSARILIADNDEGLVDVVARRCETFGAWVERAYDGISALEKIDTFAPDLIILDDSMPGESGFSVRTMLEQHPSLHFSSIIILTGRKDDEVNRCCDDLLAHYVRKGPDMWSRLEPLLMEWLALRRPKLGNLPQKDSSLVRRADGIHSQTSTDDSGVTRPVAPTTSKDVPRPDAQAEADRLTYLDAVFTSMGTTQLLLEQYANEMTRPWVLCVDDDTAFVDTLTLRLQQHGVEVLNAFAGVAGYRMAFTSPAEVIILDQNMPNGSGDYILRRLKENVVTRHIPVIVLTGARDRMLERRMYNLGAAQYFTKPVNWDDLWAELRRHIRLTNQSTVT